MTNFFSVAEIMSMMAAAAALWVAIAERHKKKAEHDSIITDASIKLVNPLRIKIDLMEKEIECRDATLRMLDSRIDFLEKEIGTRDKLIASMSADLDEKKTQIWNMQLELEKKTRTIQDLEIQVNKLMKAYQDRNDIL